MKAFALSSLRPGFAAAAGIASLLFQGVGQADASTKPISPAYNTTFSESSQNTPAGFPVPASFGYFFETTIDQTELNALGFPVFGGWADNPSQFPNAQTFDVYVWRIKGADQPSLAACNGSTPYCQVAKVTFDQTQASSYEVRDGYYWQKFSPINLGAKTSTDADVQYAVAAVGNFSLASGLPTLVGGSGTFDPAFSWEGNGFNVSTAFPPVGDPNYDPNLDYSDDFPVPWNFASEPPSADDPYSVYAYFNPNLSYSFVPSPLPLLGAGAAFGWARRIRRRVDLARVSALG